MDAVQVQDTPVFWQGALTLGFKLLGERLVEATDRARAGGNAHQGLGHFPDLVCAGPSDKHLCESFCNMGFIPAVTFKRLGVELAFTISGHLDIFDPP